MTNNELVIIGLIVVLASVLAYRSKFLHSKKIGYISLLQILYLIVVPGLLYTILFSYIFEVVQRPLNSNNFLSDRLIISVLMLSILYTYGGLAIHSISKTLSNYFTTTDKQTLFYKVNNYFHREFSHNLVYIGAIVSALGFALLEINHQSPYPEGVKLIIPLVNGFIIGLALISGLSWYKQRWLELRLFFISFWAMFIILLIALKPYFKQVQNYPITFSMLIAGILIALLNVFLYIRKVKNKIKVIFKIPKKLFD
jgi:hypothetical protein